MLIIFYYHLCLQRPCYRVVRGNNGLATSDKNSSIVVCTECIVCSSRKVFRISLRITDRRGTNVLYSACLSSSSAKHHISGNTKQQSLIFPVQSNPQLHTPATILQFVIFQFKKNKRKL